MPWEDDDRRNACATPARGTLAGLIGEGIAASLTPALHMAEAAAQGSACVYRLLDLDRLDMGVADLPKLLKNAIDLGYDGLNVTHPCKQAIMPLLDSIDPDAEAIGAVNTVRIRDGLTRGFNTDASGFAAGLAWSIGEIGAARIVQLGAGGAGAATAAAALRLGASHVAIHDIDPARAAALVDRLAARFGDGKAGIVADLPQAMAGAQGLIHATPTGMAAHPGLPLDKGLLRPDLWVAEIVYFPLETELLRAARVIGCRTVDGGMMAVFQAVGAFEIFTGRKADADRMIRHFAALTNDGGEK